VIARHEDHLGRSDPTDTVCCGKDQVTVRAVNHARGAEVAAEAGASDGEQRPYGRGAAEASGSDRRHRRQPRLLAQGLYDSTHPGRQLARG